MVYFIFLFVFYCIVYFPIGILMHCLFSCWYWDTLFICLLVLRCKVYFPVVIVTFRSRITGKNSAFSVHGMCTHAQRTLACSAKIEIVCPSFSFKTLWVHSLYNTIVVACWNFLCIPPYSNLHIRLFDDTVDAPPPHILMYSSFLVIWCIVKCPSGFVMHCIFSWLYWGALNRILIVFWCIVRPY